jgi:hypothetical protein
MKTSFCNHSIRYPFHCIFILFITMTGCVTVSELLWHIPVLFILSYAGIYFSKKSRHPLLAYSLILLISCIFLIIFMTVKPIHEMIGVYISDNILYFLLQFIPYFIYTGIIAVILHFLHKKNIPFIPSGTCATSLLSAFFVLIVHAASLLSGGCTECPLNNLFMFLFGWVFYILDKI